MGKRDRHKRSMERKQQEVERSHNALNLHSGQGDRRVEFRSGPLPQPEDFEGYERALPGAAERLLVMAEKEQAHRHRLEESDTEHEHRQEKRGLAWGGTLTLAGMIAALIAVLSVLAAGVWLILEGKNVAGYGSLISAVIAIISVFVQAARARRKE